MAAPGDRRGELPEAVAQDAGDVRGLSGRHQAVHAGAPLRGSALGAELHPWQIVALGRYSMWGWPEMDAGGDLVRAGIMPDPVPARLERMDRHGGPHG